MEHVESLSLTPPPRTEQGIERGYACMEHPETGGQPTHDACPGWWPQLGSVDYDGWRCACRCHEDGRGWPGHPDHDRFLHVVT